MQKIFIFSNAVVSLHVYNLHGLFFSGSHFLVDLFFYTCLAQTHGYQSA